MTDRNDWEMAKPRKKFDGDIEVGIWEVDWSALPSYDGSEDDDD